MKRLVRVLVLLNAVWPVLLVSGICPITNIDAIQPKDVSGWTYSTSDTSGTKNIKNFDEVYSKHSDCDKPSEGDCKGYLVSDLEAAGYDGS